MTSAARPTFTPALGGNNLTDRITSSSGSRGGIGGPASERYSSKDQASHGTIKVRSTLQKRTCQPMLTATSGGKSGLLALKGAAGGGSALSEKLKALSQRIQFDTASSQEEPVETITSNHETQDNTTATTIQDNGNEEKVTEEISEQISGNEDDSESDDSDDEAALLQELAYLQATRQEKQRQKEEQELLYSNPLLNNQQNSLNHDDSSFASFAAASSASAASTSFRVKQRWDADVVFKRTSDTNNTGSSGRPFVNDMVRSEFHKKFMKKYIQ